MVSWKSWVFLENGYCQSNEADAGISRHLMQASDAAEGNSSISSLPTSWALASHLTYSSILLCKIWLIIALTSLGFVRIQQQWNQINFAKCVVLYKGKGGKRTSVSLGSVLSWELRRFWARWKLPRELNPREAVQLAGADTLPRIRAWQC